jgi:hypothetical protein
MTGRLLRPRLCEAFRQISTRCADKVAPRTAGLAVPLDASGIAMTGQKDNATATVAATRAAAARRRRRTQPKGTSHAFPQSVHEGQARRNAPRRCQTPPRRPGSAGTRRPARDPASGYRPGSDGRHGPDAPPPANRDAAGTVRPPRLPDPPCGRTRDHTPPAAGPLAARPDDKATTDGAARPDPARSGPRFRRSWPSHARGGSRVPDLPRMAARRPSSIVGARTPAGDRAGAKDRL